MVTAIIVQTSMNAHLTLIHVHLMHNVSTPMAPIHVGVHLVTTATVTHARMLMSVTKNLIIAMETQAVPINTGRTLVRVEMDSRVMDIIAQVSFLISEDLYQLSLQSTLSTINSTLGSMGGVAARTWAGFDLQTRHQCELSMLLIFDIPIQS
jgi:hypothetical protein